MIRDERNKAPGTCNCAFIISSRWPSRVGAANACGLLFGPGGRYVGGDNGGDQAVIFAPRRFDAALLRCCPNPIDLASFERASAYEGATIG